MHPLPAPPKEPASHPRTARRTGPSWSPSLTAAAAPSVCSTRPDTGTPRGDLLDFLRQVSASVSEIAGTPSRIAAIIQHAIEGGEIDRPRVALLPVDLVRHDVIMNQVPAPDDTLIEIVDRFFLS